MDGPAEVVSPDVVVLVPVVVPVVVTGGEVKSVARKKLVGATLVGCGNTLNVELELGWGVPLQTAWQVPLVKLSNAHDSTSGTPIGAPKHVPLPPVVY